MYETYYYGIYFYDIYLLYTALYLYEENTQAPNKVF